MGTVQPLTFVRIAAIVKFPTHKEINVSIAAIFLTVPHAMIAPLVQAVLQAINLILTKTHVLFVLCKDVLYVLRLLHVRLA